MGLALSGWMGFLVLAGVLLATRPAMPPDLRTAREPPVADVSQPDTGHRIVARLQHAEPPAVSQHAEPPAGLQPVMPPAVATVAQRPVVVLTTYEERRRVQEQVRQADAADHEEGNVSAARSFYEYAAGRGWAPAALALAFTYDPHELQRRGVTIAADPAKAGACYVRARELMEAAVAFYLSRLPPRTGEGRC